MNLAIFTHGTQAKLSRRFLLSPPGGKLLIINRQPFSKNPSPTCKIAKAILNSLAETKTFIVESTFPAQTDTMIWHIKQMIKLLKTSL